MAFSKETALAYAQKRGDESRKNGFTSVIRSFDFNGMVEGEEFVIPENWREVAHAQQMGTKSNGEPFYMEYIFVETQNGVKQFPIGMFSKNIRVYENTKYGEPLKPANNPDGTPIWKHVLGTATDLFRSAAPDPNAGLDLLAAECKKGKKIKLVKANNIITRAFNRDVLTTQKQFTIDLIDNSSNTFCHKCIYNSHKS